MQLLILNDLSHVGKMQIFKVKGVLHPQLKLECFVCYLKIINTFSKK